MRSKRQALGAIVAIILMYFCMGVFSSLYLVPWDAEAGYVVLGASAIRGEIGLYQDEVPGGRLPLPFYVLGASQLVAGRNLLIARFLSLILGAVVLWFTFLLACHVVGVSCGVLSALFLACNSLVVGYFAAASYFSLSSLLIAAGLYFLYARGWAKAAMSTFSVLSLTRPNLAVIVPAMLLLMWQGRKHRAERAWLVGIAVAPPLLFLLSNPDHLKVLMHVPILGGMVRGMGYESLLTLGGEAFLSQDRGLAFAVWWFVRRHIVWCLPALGLGAAWAASRVAGARPFAGTPREIREIALLFAYSFVWQWIILIKYPKSVAAWTATLSPLVGVLLGYAATRMVDRASHHIALIRWTVIAGLGATFLVGPTVSAHTAMPLPLPVSGTTIGLLQVVASEISERAPPKSRVFVLGSAVPPYLAGLSLYPQQVISPWTLVPSKDVRVVSRSGVWGPHEAEAWLTRDAAYALVEPRLLDLYQRLPGYAPTAQRIGELLLCHFELVVKVNYPGIDGLSMYRRKSVPSC